MALTLPYINVLRRTSEFSTKRIDEYLRLGLSLSQNRPCYMEVAERDLQLYLFFREKQIYAAGMIQKQQINNLTIKEFLLASSEMKSPQVALFEVNNKILHSILIVFQKKPSIKILTSLVDLDKLLDKIEEEGKSCIINASQEDFFAILRYEKGRVTALCHEHSLPHPQEESFREDFLVKIYTLSAEKQLLISLYEDLLVQFANDAKLVSDSYVGSIVDLFLSKPPVVILQFKNKEVGRWVLEKPETRIGRTPDNDIVIDNLAVSRLHAVLEEDKGAYYIKDCDSLNGTLLNGGKIGRARLSNGDHVDIGKHTILFYKQEGRVLTSCQPVEGFDQTVVISPVNNSQEAVLHPTAPANIPEMSGDELTDAYTEHRAPRLLEKTPDGERIIELLKPSLIMGNDASADIAVEGFLVAKRHAEIARRGDHYIIRHLKGIRKVKVGGRSISESVLQPNDKITIANSEFIFLE